MMDKGECGINPVFWCTVYFGIFLLFAVLKVFTYFMVGSSSEGTIIGYYIGIFAITVLLFVGWIIYGYMLYFSDDNNCQKDPQVFIWLVIMVILLFFGFFGLMAFAIGICVFCCLGAAMVGASKEGEGKPGALDGLTKKFYNPDDYKFSDTCAIC